MIIIDEVKILNAKVIEYTTDYFLVGVHPALYPTKCIKFYRKSAILEKKKIIEVHLSRVRGKI